MNYHCLKNESGKTLRAALTLPPCWLGNVPEGQEKQSDDIIQKLMVICILSFQGPTASFAIQQGVVLVSCDRFV